MNSQSKSRSILFTGVAVLVSASLVLPPNLAAQAAGQRAGQIAKVIPSVQVERNKKKMTAAAQLPVDWQDLVETQKLGRARVDLDDGSILNVGSNSTISVTKHDAGAQQTEVEMTYGAVRSKVVKITRPDGKFEIHTPGGVAGVVGTDFFLSYVNGMTQVIVFEGHVRFCDLSGNCVLVGGGEFSTIRAQGQKPDEPAQATTTMLTEAALSTSVEGAGPATVAPHHINPWVITGVVIGIAVPAIAVPLALRGAPQNPCAAKGQTAGC